MPDRELLAQFAQSGSQDAYAEIVRRHAGAVYGTCLRVLGNAHEAEDAAQATFLIFLRKGRALPASTVLLDWLHRTARNAARNLRREEFRRAMREGEAAAMAGGGGEGRGAGGEATWNEIRPHLDEALDDLPTAQRQALKLHYLRGLTRAEVATELDCPERTVESRLRLGLEKLREKLARRGAVVPAAALVGFLGERVLAEQAPSTLIASIQALGTAPAAASAAASATAEVVMKAMMWAKVKLWAAACVGVVVVGTGGAVAVKGAMAGDPPRPVATAPAPVVSTEPARPAMPPATAKEPIPQEENAAVYYRKAFAAIPAAEGEVAQFLNSIALSATPDAIPEMPGAVELILKHKEMVDLVHKGAQLRKCDFEIDWEPGVATLLDHVQQMRAAAKRMVAYGKYLESQDKSGEVFDLEAAEKYLDVLRMACHLDQDSVLISEMVGIAIGGIGTGALNRQMAGDVGEQTAQRILEGLSRIPACPFDLSKALAKERAVFGKTYFDKLLAAARKSRQDLMIVLATLHAEVLSFPDKAAKPVGPAEVLKMPEYWLLPTDQKDLVKQVEDWRTTYDNEMSQLASVTKEPFPVAKPKLEQMEKALEARSKQSLETFGVAYQPGLLVPAASRIYASAVRFEARLGATKLLAAACLEKARTGKFPAALDGLKKHFPKGLPVDPFTSKDFLYRIENGLPTVECEGDDPQYKKRNPAVFIFSLSEMKRDQERRAADWRAVRRGEKPPSPPLAPEPFPGDPEIF